LDSGKPHKYLKAGDDKIKIINIQKTVPIKNRNGFYEIDF